VRKEVGNSDPKEMERQNLVLANRKKGQNCEMDSPFRTLIFMEKGTRIV
jgi:hypothetical protein